MTGDSGNTVCENCSDKSPLKVSFSLIIRSAQAVGDDMEPIRVLLVDDDQAVLEMMQRGLESQRFQGDSRNGGGGSIGTDRNTDTFDVLVTDQRMPGPAHGFTLVSATRRRPAGRCQRSSPAGTRIPREPWLLIVLQADEILMKPHDVRVLGELIRKRMATHEGSGSDSKGECRSDIEARSDS